MDFLEQYLNGANEIIGDRTKDEERYDKEVLRWLRKGKGIEKAIKKANQKYPKESLNVDGIRTKGSRTKGSGLDN